MQEENSPDKQKFGASSAAFGKIRRLSPQIIIFRLHMSVDDGTLFRGLRMGDWWKELSSFFGPQC